MITLHIGPFHLTQRNYKLNLSTSGSSKNTTCSPLLFLGRKKELVMVMVMRNTDTQFSLTKGNNFTIQYYLSHLQQRFFFHSFAFYFWLWVEEEVDGYAYMTEKE